MSKLHYDTVVDRIADTLVTASTTFTPDQMRAYAHCKAKETNPNAGWVLEKLIENAEEAEKNALPLCDDTGTPHVIIELGKDATLPGDFLPAVEAGVAEGLRRLPARAMGVLGDDKERVSQKKGLSDDPGHLAMAPLRIIAIPGNAIRVTVLMLGGGPELRGKTLRVFHKHNFQVVLDEMVAWAKEAVALLGCQPAILAFGVGRSNFEASSLALEALKNADFDVQTDVEKEITDRVNAEHIGALGLGGDTSVLATFVKIGAQRASGWRVVSLRTECCVGPRRATCEF
ncbi:fumarate hydratase [Desulfovibrio sp. OttesenSCG-928-I05]|nr:fumarate hydratase [Desulfovibrio sp. OttesenSCG-928-I05]